MALFLKRAPWLPRGETELLAFLSRLRAAGVTRFETADLRVELTPATRPAPRPAAPAAKQVVEQATQLPEFLCPCGHTMAMHDEFGCQEECSIDKCQPRAEVNHG